MNRNPRVQQVGVDRLIRLQWLIHTTRLLLAGNSEHSIKVALEESLSASFTSSMQTVRGSLSKTITILLKTWVRVPRELEPLRNEGLELLRRNNEPIQMPIHWGMLSAVYPFWGAVASQTGRLLRLQGKVGASQVQRRLREQYGERETVARRVRYVLRAFVDWGVLSEAGAKGVYSQGLSLVVDDSQLVSWLIEASLHSRANGSAPLKDLIESPSLFPFRLKQIAAESLQATSPRLDLLHHGLDDDLVMLRKPVM